MKEVIFQSTEHDDENPINAEYYNNFNSDVVVTYENGETLIYYDCLADSATTSYVSNCQDAFTTFNPSHKIKVGGVSGIQMCAKGCGTIELELVYEGCKYMLMLNDVLYIPRNKNNLVSLGCWSSRVAMHARMYSFHSLV
jgi:hypothetical protein